MLHVWLPRAAQGCRRRTQGQQQSRCQRPHWVRRRRRGGKLLAQRRLALRGAPAAVTRAAVALSAQGGDEGAGGVWGALLVGSRLSGDGLWRRDCARDAQADRQQASYSGAPFPRRRLSRSPPAPPRSALLAPCIRRHPSGQAPLRSHPCYC